MDRGTLRPRTPLEEYVFGALRAGAAGFLFKDAPRERLLEAIRVVHGGEALLSPSITRRLIEDFAARTDPLEPPTSSSSSSRHASAKCSCSSHGDSQTARSGSGWS
jgi:DNA-binding NarL/FixJ family response regulator